MEEYFVPFRTVLAYISYGLYVALSDMYTQIFDGAQLPCVGHNIILRIQLLSFKALYVTYNLVTVLHLFRFCALLWADQKILGPSG